MPAFFANPCNTYSHAPTSLSSSRAGNLPIQREPSTSVKFAFGLAPPRDAPGATKPIAVVAKANLSTVVRERADLARGP